MSGRTPRLAQPGDVFHRLTVVAEAEPTRTNPARPVRQVLCSCECGGTKVISVHSLCSDATKSCGCIERERIAAAQATPGDQYGRLTVVRLVEPRVFTGTTAQRALCACECGTERVFLVGHLRSGATTSCGCRSRIHGHASHTNGRSPTYITWMSMRARCARPSNPDWDHYGGRGIRVCDRWQTFENFLADMGERPADRTLDRIDPDGNYEPGNCRWATAVEQRANRRDSR